MDELVEIPTGPRVFRWPGALFLVALLATALADQLAPLGAPRLVGKERAREKQLVDGARFSDGTLARLAERRLRLNSRVRRRVAPYWIALATRYLKCPSDDVVIGRDGWLFLRERTHGEDPESAISLTQRLCLAMDRRLSGRGARLVMLPIPRKSTSARALLPKGFDRVEGFDPSVDTALAERLSQGGVRVVEATKAWRELPAGAPYLPLDTHWSGAGQRALAAEVARLYPAPPEARASELTVKRRTEPARAALLNSIGVGEDYPAGALFPKGTEERMLLAPTDLPRPMDDPWALLVGTSFTAEFDFHAHLSLATRSRIGKTAIAATSFGTSLAAAIASYGPRSLPSTIFFEFPVHEIFTLGRRSTRVDVGLAKIFELLPPAATAPLGWSLPKVHLEPEQVAAKASDTTLLSFRPGELLTSGDGALSLQINVEDGRPSRWELRLDGMRFVWKAPAGRSSIYLPLVEGGELGGAIELVALGQPTRLPKVSMTPVLDAPPGRTRDWSGPGRIGRHDLALVQWPKWEGSGPAMARASGRTPAGAPVEASWSFPRVEAPGAVLGLTQFRGGFLDAFSLTGPGGVEIEVEIKLVSRGD